VSTTERSTDVASFFDRIRDGLAKTAQQIKQRLGEAVGDIPASRPEQPHLRRAGIRRAR
jgi:hypothetical protein